MVIFPRIQKIKTFHDIPGVTNCSRTILFESRNIIDEFKYIAYDIETGETKNGPYLKFVPTDEIMTAKHKRTVRSKLKTPIPETVSDSIQSPWNYASAFKVNTILDKEYLEYLKMGIYGKSVQDIHVEAPVIIINRSEMVKTNHKTKSRELEISTNLYLGTCYANYMIDKNGDIKLSQSSRIVINNSHYVTIYKQLDDYGSSYINLENYSSFDHNPNHKMRERWIKNDQSKRMNFFDPDPRYYNQEHQIKATGGDDESFIYKSLRHPEGVPYTLGELMDDNTTIGRMYIKIEKLIELAEKIKSRGEVFFAPDVLIYQLYTLFSHVKYDLDGHCVTSADVIMSTDNGWNVKNIRLGSDNLYKDMKLRSEIVKELLITINGRYENFFKPFLSIGYDFELYMHLSIVNNNMKVVFKDIKGSTHIGLDGMIEEISTGQNNTNERRGF